MKISGRVYFAVLLVLVLLAFLPVLSVDQPPLADYPNHLARVHVWLVHGTDNAVPHIEPVLALQPNMAFELVVGLLAKFMPLEQAGKGFVLLTVISMVVGPAILGRFLWGGFSFTSFLPVLFIYNRLFFWGFLGYLFSLGVALALSSLWLFSANTKRAKSLWFLAASFASFVVLSLHLYAYAVFCIIVLILVVRENGHLWSDRRKWFLGVVFGLIPLLTALPIFAVGAPVFESEHIVRWGPFFSKIAAFGGLLIGPNARFDLILGLGSIVLLVSLLAFSAVRFRLDKFLLGGVLILLVMHLAMPSQLMSSYGADQRLPIAIALFMVAAIAPPEIDRPFLVRSVLMCLLLIFAARMQGVRSDWATYQKFHSDLVAAYKILPRGTSALSLVGTSSQYGLPRMPLTEHFGFAVVERSIFWPGMFAYPLHGAQTIEFDGLLSIPSGIAALQKIPISIFNEVVSGGEAYQKYAQLINLQCYQFIAAVREDGIASILPDKAAFGTVFYRGEHILIYRNHRAIDC